MAGSFAPGLSQELDSSLSAALRTLKSCTAAFCRHVAASSLLCFVCCLLVMVCSCRCCRTRCPVFSWNSVQNFAGASAFAAADAAWRHFAARLPLHDAVPLDSAAQNHGRGSHAAAQCVFCLLCFASLCFSERFSGSLLLAAKLLSRNVAELVVDETAAVKPGCRSFLVPILARALCVRACRRNRRRPCRRRWVACCRGRCRTRWCRR